MPDKPQPDAPDPDPGAVEDVQYNVDTWLRERGVAPDDRDPEPRNREERRRQKRQRKPR